MRDISECYERKKDYKRSSFTLISFALYLTLDDERRTLNFHKESNKFTKGRWPKVTKLELYIRIKPPNLNPNDN